MKTILTQLFTNLYQDEAGFIVSAELILIATITVIACVVGLAEVSNSINNELHDCANAFDSVNQSYSYEPDTRYDDRSSSREEAVIYAR
jgi:hypothetical protein